MIKAKLNNGDLILGLSKENIKRLQQGNPISFNLNDMNLEDRNVMIFYGETEDDMYEQLFPNMTKETKINIDGTSNIPRT